eukprot:scaffold1277_cov253-Pinguiococcus_pyrenoidosus.AAC.34
MFREALGRANHANSVPPLLAFGLPCLSRGPVDYWRPFRAPGGPSCSSLGSWRGRIGRISAALTDRVFRSAQAGARQQSSSSGI